MSIFTRKKNSILHKLQHLFVRKKPDNWFVRKKDSLASRYGLPLGIGIAIIVAIFLTTISMTLYFISDTAKLDLSRPGYESVRNQISREGNNSDNFSANGALDGAVMKDFIKMYDKRAKSLGQYDIFNQNILDDSQIGLVEQQTAPSDGAIE